MLEHLDATFNQLDALNSYVFDRKVRQYQFDILTEGAFTLISPFTGRALSCAEARLLPFVNDPYHFELPLYAYRFADQRDIWVMSFQIGMGFPICALFIEGVFTGYPYSEPAASIRPKLLARLSEAYETLKPAGASPQTHTKPLAVLGHPNFAHHMWNELPGLNRLKPKHNFDILRLFSPVKTLTDDEPAQAFKPLRRTKAPFFTPIGGQYLDDDTSAQIKDALPACTAIANPDSHTVIWVAYRDDGRVCENFLDFLTAFDHQCRSTFRPVYIFDSFSAPDDFDQPWYDPVRSAFRSRQSQSEILFAAMRACLSNPDSCVHTTSNLSVSEAMSLAHHADFYISPIGSIHHKVAWLQDIPGIVHGPKTTMNTHVANWHGNQAALARAPDFIPSDMIEDLAPSKHHPEAERNLNYRFTDPEAAAKHTLERLQEALQAKL